MLFAEAPTPTREQQVWSEEVARVFAEAPTFEPAVRRAVRATLQALADDPSTDEATRADAVAMLSVTGPFPARLGLPSGRSPTSKGNGRVGLRGLVGD
ncbi:MAG: hypothetical protein ACXVRK_05185 [Gaiellaceae bacterium]